MELVRTSLSQEITWFSIIYILNEDEVLHQKAILFLNCDNNQLGECQQPYVCRWQKQKILTAFSETIVCQFVT